MDTISTPQAGRAMEYKDCNPNEEAVARGQRTVLQRTRVRECLGEMSERLGFVLPGGIMSHAFVRACVCRRDERASRLFISWLGNPA